MSTLPPLNAGSAQHASHHDPALPSSASVSALHRASPDPAHIVLDPYPAFFNLLSQNTRDTLQPLGVASALKALVPECDGATLARAQQEAMRLAAAPDLTSHAVASTAALHMLPPILMRGDWAPANLQALEALLRVYPVVYDVRKNGPLTAATAAQLHPEAMRIAALDWDGTAIAGDMSFTMLAYFLNLMLLRLTRNDLERIFSTGIGHIPRVLRDGKWVTPHKICGDILEAYDRIFPDHNAHEIPAMDLACLFRFFEGIHPDKHAHGDFRAHLLSFYDALETTPGLGANVAYPWLTTLFAGYTDSDLRTIVDLLLKGHILSAPMEDVTWTTSQMAQGSGPASFHMHVGVRPQPEIIDLLEALQDRGILPVVISASHASLVKQAAQTMGYPIAEDHIFGMQLAVDPTKNNIFTTVSRNMPMLDPDAVCHHKSGKTAVLDRFINTLQEQHYAKRADGSSVPVEEVLALGDTNGDADFLKRARHRLIIHRNQDGEVGTMIANATHDPTTLVQGRDHDSGRFRPHHKSLFRHNNSTPAANTP